VASESLSLVSKITSKQWVMGEMKIFLAEKCESAYIVGNNLVIFQECFTWFV